jgi:NAD(P)-dependent dehydrogenase (short-subunit alcohol dehydrogenase family)
MKNILLIGGSYGIGASLTKILSEDNNVIVASRTKPEQELDNVKYIEFDASCDEIDLSLIPETIDGFVYLPGSINLRPFKGLSIDAFKQDLEINVLSLIRILKSILPKLILSNNASLVFLSTVAVSQGMPFHSSVAVSKGAIEGLAKSLAAEYAPKFRVNVIAPSIVDTPLANRFLNNETKIQKSSEKHPLNRIGKKEDIAEMIGFLLSDKSSWMTGQVLGIDGGLSTIKKN